MPRTEPKRYQPIPVDDPEAMARHDRDHLRAAMANIDGVFPGETVAPLAMMIDPKRPAGKVKVYRRSGTLRGHSFFFRVAQYKHIAGVRDENGELAFTTNPDAAPAPVVGSQKCFLHPEHPNHELVEELGIADQCFKDTLPRGPVGLQSHAESKHKGQWGSYQAALAQAEKEADRAREDARWAAMMKTREAGA